MTTDLLAVLVAIVAVGVTTTGLVVSGFRRMGDKLDALGVRVGTLEQRMARLEGVIETLQSVLLRRIDRDQDAA